MNTMKKVRVFTYIFFILLILCGCDVKNEPLHKYNVTFDYDNGEVAEIIEAVEGFNIEKPFDEPIKEGYTFDGWYLNEEKFSFDTKINEDIILKAKWVIKKYKVSFDSLGGSIINDQEIEYDELVEKPNNPIYKGYNFIGWFHDKEGIDEFDFTSFKIKSDITVYAKWEGQVDYFKLFEDQMKENLKSIDMKQINLIDSFEGIKNIEWNSENCDIIDCNGNITRPYTKTSVKIIAEVELNDGEKDTIEFEVEIPGYKLDTASTISCSYLYRNYTKMDDILFEALDIIICAFAVVDENGNLSGSTKSFFNNVKQYILPKAKENGVYVLLSLAPGSKWTEFTNPSNNVVDKAVDNSIAIMEEYGFDGIDIDWERPKSGQETWFTNFAKKLNVKLKQKNPNYLLTAAIGAGKWQPPSYDLPNSEKYLDYVNVMSYGMETSSRHYQNALYKSSHSTTSCSIDETVSIYENLKVARSKLIFGLAFYGIRQDYVDGAWVKKGSVLYNALLESYLNEGNTEYEVFYDDIAQVPYIMNKDKTIFISYDNERSIKVKCQYVIDNNIGGVMAWEAGCDLSGSLLRAVKEGLNK